ncbi:GDP-mannose 4,6-dehydratase [Marinifilum caeruleilacunae]|uniref:NAD-dependent epimerase/dehydratase family protein n=1 Tax=Marinifilum caeruleilacunae TaxID=2499076 RepID=A0ABX1WUV8_9BACT|nr:GDP-mannose 4,6-dehydratase [Marinifilum caeruleilacunae]NOU59883.1 NAD-dependent epimerase/dehydratase family protein [Marinifilum caeruleilacunae]
MKQENKRKQKILVTGCAGFIGSHLCERLLQVGYPVVGIDNFDPFYSIDQKMENMEGFKRHKAFSFYQLDLCQGATLQRVQEDVSLIVHLAGKAGVRPSIEDPQGYIDSNISATRNILDFMNKRGIKKLAFASSSSVYGNNKLVPFTEDQNVDHVISPYAFSKKACELLNHSYHHLYNLDIVNMRFFTVFGPRQRPDLAIHKFLNLMMKEEAIPVFGEGSTARDYTYVEDTVDGILKTCEYLFANKNVFETINLGNSYPIRLSEMIESIAKTSGIRPIINRMPMQAGDVNQTFANIRKAQDLIGYDPKFSFEEGMKLFVEWFKRIHIKEIVA